AVTYMISELANAGEFDTYNMLIYLSLLGPVATDAIPAVGRARLKNPVLRQLTKWAIDPGGELPWANGTGGPNIAQWIVESYVQELGDHLKPVAATLARRIMAASAGEVPPWGYKLLARFPEQSLTILAPGLDEQKLVNRERATVAIGYMGKAAA